MIDIVTNRGRVTILAKVLNIPLATLARPIIYQSLLRWQPWSLEQRSMLERKSVLVEMEQIEDTD